ncbi:hypothetical protein, partial [Helicobacter sp. 12S02232-10]|uniref:hypothetical protein n=1 Tax=Helicobacter sp. 12S02232-10 TaxID=1476197 RepID=UPI0015DF4207
TPSQNFQNKNSSKSKKRFFPLFSFVLAALLFPFSGEILRADDVVSGDTSCLLGGTTSCAQLITNPSFPNLNLTKGNGGYQFTYTQAKDNFPDTVVLNANNTTVNFYTNSDSGLYGANLFDYNVKTDINFKNSLWQGNLAISIDNLPNSVVINNATGKLELNFNGGIEGSNPSATNYAFIGDINFIISPTPVKINFTNNVFKGNASAERQSPYYDWQLAFKNAQWIGNFFATLDLNSLNFNNSTWTGNASNNEGTLNAVFKGSKWTGDFSNTDTGTTNLNFSDNSTWTGNAKASWGALNAAFKDSTMTGSISNGANTTWNWTLDHSTINGDINVSNSVSTLNFSLKKESKITGKITNGANMIWNLDHSSVQASADLNNNGYAANTKIIAKNQ